MTHRYLGDFVVVKPSGVAGDKKCDGYHSSLGRVFQVYAPERLTASKAIAKINEDYTGASANWQDLMKEWVFVHNQHRGLHPDVAILLAKIKKAKKHAIQTWCEVELKDVFFGLSTADQASILGAAPTQESLTRLEMQDVVVVARVIAQQEPTLNESVDSVPLGKLEANGLTDYTKSFLLMGSRKAPLVKKLFDQWHDPELGDKIAAAFRARYLALRNEGLVGDDLFKGLWKFAGGGQYPTAKQEAAAMAILAFLFEECEIFESPSASVNQ